MPPVTFTGPEDFVLPAVWCPIPPSLHHSWEELDAQALAWAGRFELRPDPVQRERLAQALAGDLAGRIMPHSDAGSGLQIATD